MLASVVLAPILGCGGGNASEAPASVTINCGASDEAWLAMQDLVNATGAHTDDVRAARLSAPAAGALLSAATPTTFQWTLSLPVTILPHGIDSGSFVWLHFTGAGLSAPFDVISVDPGKPDADAGVLSACLSYTPSAADWARLAGASGTLTLSLYTAKESLNVVTEGPFQPTTNAFTFTVTP